MVDSPGQTVATGPLLETKLYVPKWRPSLVSRPRLVERLDQGIERRLTLVSAPAGFGKTTMLAEWLASAPAGRRPAAWVSLDQSDSDPALFWAYFIASLQTVHSGVGESALSMLRSPQPPPIEAILTTLINEINAVEQPLSSELDFVLVLDDYHLIDAQPIHSAITFLVDHLPLQMHLVIASRSDPPLPLARLRGRGESTELRAADLRFTPHEAAAFLNDAMGLDLTTGDATALETRTEGWIAGLQLAALSMQGRGDVHGFIETFAGDDRYIVDYLVEEVLSRQPERVRSFLAQTSILDRLSGPLCNAITGREDGRGMLESLERGNLFVVPLDDKRQWYRYHHLFADVLHAHSMEEEPDRVPILHRRASEWYENNGLRADAIHHALAAEDFERAAGLVELAERAMRTSNQEDTLREWLKALPDELIRARPVLSAGYAWTLLVRGEIEAADARLQDAERWLDAATGTSERPGALSAEMVVVDEEGYRSLPGSIAAARTFYAQALGDFPSVEKYARLALELIPESNYFERAIPGGILALAYWAKGDLEAAHRSLTEGMANLRRSGHIDLAISGTFILAHIRATQGRLHEAIGMCERSLQLAMEQGGPVLRGTADIHVGLSELNVEQGDLAAQDAYQYNSRVARARLKEVQGDLNGALDILDEADRVYTEGVVPNLRPAATLKTRVWVAQSRPAEAQGWVHKRGLSADDDLSYLTEFEHITLAKVLIARHKSDRQERQIHEAAGLLERLLKAAEEGGRTRSVIEILVLQAIAYQARGDTSRALNPLERALILAEPEGYVQIFVDEGEAMRDLLRHAAARDVASSYARRLLSAFDGPSLPASTLVKAAVSDLAEPLTGREVEVLRLVAAGMRNQEIADQLFISLSTVKRHIANAYGKLGVGHRTEAVARANELNLL